MMDAKRAKRSSAGTGTETSTADLEDPLSNGDLPLGDIKDIKEDTKAPVDRFEKAGNSFVVSNATDPTCTVMQVHFCFFQMMYNGKTPPKGGAVFPLYTSFELRL